MHMPQETCNSLCTNVSPNSACVWAKGHKGFLGKYYTLYNNFQWLLCSPPAGGWRQPSVHAEFIAWNLLAPGATFIWLYSRAVIQPPRWRELAGMPTGWHFLSRSSAQPMGLCKAWGSYSSSLVAPQPCLQEGSATLLPGVKISAIASLLSPRLLWRKEAHLNEKKCPKG